MLYAESVSVSIVLALCDRRPKVMESATRLAVYFSFK